MRFMFRAPLLALVSFLLPLAAQAQTQAACTFKFFSTKTNITASNGNPVFLQPLGIDDFSTIVGFGDRISAGEIGLVRWANGGIVHVSGTKALVARNDNGTMVADVRVNSTWQGVLVNGPTSSPTFTPLVLNIPLDPNAQVFPAGINKWGTVIGHYWNPDPSENAHGFKRWSNGTTHILDFPGAAPNTDTQGYQRPRHGGWNIPTHPRRPSTRLHFAQRSVGHAGLSECRGYRSGWHYQYWPDHWKRGAVFGISL